MKLTTDFFNKAMYAIKTIYFVDSQSEMAMKTKYAMECFNNGVITYNDLVQKLSLYCKDAQEEIHLVLSQFVEDFEGFKFSPCVDDTSETLNFAVNSFKERTVTALQKKLKTIFDQYNEKLVEEGEDPIDDKEFLNLEHNIIYEPSVVVEDTQSTSYVDEIRMDGRVISIREEGDNYEISIVVLEAQQIIDILEIIENTQEPEIL